MILPSRLVRFLAQPAAVLALAALAHPARAGLTFFSTQAAFTAADPGLVTETFEASRVPANTFAIIPGPLDSSSSNAAFSPGDIQAGVSFAAVGNDPNTNLIAAGAGTVPGASKSLGVLAPVDSLEITLANSTAIGLNLAASTGPGSLTPASFFVQVFGASGLLGSETVMSVNANGFVGVSAGSTAITKVDITEVGATANTFIDNVSFGNTAQPQPPTSPTYGPTSDRAAFLLAHPGLSTEGFEASQAPAGGYIPLAGPLSSTSVNPAFGPGGLLPGLTLASVGGDSNTFLIATGTGTTPGGTKEIGLSSGTNSLELTFAQAQAAVGFTLLDSNGPGNLGSAIFDVAVYGASGLIETDKVDVSGLDTFFGVAEAQGITRIDITNEAGYSSVFVDDLNFTPADSPTPTPTPVAVPEPASVAMVGLGLAAVAACRSRRRRPALG